MAEHRTNERSKGRMFRISIRDHGKIKFHASITTISYYSFETNMTSALLSRPYKKSKSRATKLGCTRNMNQERLS